MEHTMRLKPPCILRSHTQRHVIHSEALCVFDMFEMQTCAIDGCLLWQHVAGRLRLYLNSSSAEPRGACGHRHRESACLGPVRSRDLAEGLSTAPHDRN